MEKGKEILENALKLIEDPEHWCRWTNFCDKDGVATPYPDQAVQYCLAGALSKAAQGYDEHSRMYARSVLNAEIAKRQLNSMHSFNDRNSHQDVITVLKDAISKA